MVAQIITVRMASAASRTGGTGSARSGSGVKSGMVASFRRNAHLKPGFEELEEFGANHGLLVSLARTDRGFEPVSGDGDPFGDRDMFTRHALRSHVIERGMDPADRAGRQRAPVQRLDFAQHLK